MAKRRISRTADCGMRFWVKVNGDLVAGFKHVQAAFDYAALLEAVPLRDNQARQVVIFDDWHDRVPR